MVFGEKVCEAAEVAVEEEPISIDAFRTLIDYGGVKSTSPVIEEMYNSLSFEQRVFFGAYLNKIESEAEISDEEKDAYADLLRPYRFDGLLENREYEPSFVGLSSDPSQEEIAFANRLKLPIILGGQLSRFNARSPIAYDPHLEGHNIYFDNRGNRYMSFMTTHFSAEKIVELRNFIESQTSGAGHMAEIVGVHFYRGQPRLIMEIIDFRKAPIHPKYLGKETKAKYHEITSPGQFGHNESYFPVVLNEYVFETKNGELKFGYPYRVHYFDEAVRGGEVFNIKE